MKQLPFYLEKSKDTEDLSLSLSCVCLCLSVYLWYNICIQMYSDPPIEGGSGYQGLPYYSVFYCLETWHFTKSETLSMLARMFGCLYICLSRPPTLILQLTKWTAILWVLSEWWDSNWSNLSTEKAYISPEPFSSSPTENIKRNKSRRLPGYI